MGFDEYLSHDNFFEMHPPLSHNGADPEVHQGESSLLIVEAAEQFIRSSLASSNAPFFVVIWFGSPHAPYRGLPEDVALYDAALGNEIRHRFAEITAMDRAIGKFRQTLEDLGVVDNTLLWYTSDNGMTREGIPAGQREALWNGDLRASKGSLYEGGVRVPGIIQWPAVVKAPRVSSVPCVTTDIFATLLGMLDLRHPQPSRPLDGVDLTPLIVDDDTMKTRPRPIGFWKYDAKAEKSNPRWIPADLTKGTTPTTRNPGIDFVNFRHPVAKTENFGGTASWLDNRYKLVSAPRGDFELYDLQADPQEQSDISADHPDLVQGMAAQLHDWQRSVELSLSGADYN
jgi:hypothetical protein